MPITSGAEYIESLRGRDIKVYLFGELVKEPVDHPMIRPSINAVAETYDIANSEPEIGSSHSSLTDRKVNRFLHIAESAQDLVNQNRMQRKLGQLTGTCFQRCVGMDALNSLYSTTFEIDGKYNTSYHKRLVEFIKLIQTENLVVGGAMTDVKGDRSLSPSQQDDPDLFVHVVKEDEKGLYISGAKAHQTGCINSHWIMVMPTMRLRPEDKEYAIVGAVPADAKGITYIYGRQSCDTRSMEAGDLDAGNAKFSGQEAMIIFDSVFIPKELVFMEGEVEFASMLVERFTCYHRRSYVCKTGLGDVLVGAAAAIADYNGIANASHIKDKLVEMTHLNETIFAAGIASSYQAHRTSAGNYQNDDMLANVCKHNVTRFPYEIGRLAQDIAGGLMVTMPSEKDFRSPETGPLLEKYLKGRKGVSTENRVRILRLIENMTLGRNAVGYLTESMHGAGSPQAQRIQIARQMQLEYKKKLAKNLASIEEGEASELSHEQSEYFDKIFGKT
ncbi:MAG: 4-hydroxyphenylacetate 3-hydroxylase N-terminal domain-containing protein [Nitrososphaeraceae archaeon]|jgi:4-hydroxybutyryl-CoA dehydratase / vinylacetyl-CoA-Delta-isomerase|nr:4-hydroxyphenylacetate 3-hydroxylase N-terminal domain-containing protein [Nitrososphaeraceae archaeon]MDW0314073.1 4-hydroxyphenylacetate 3-hydroxylase N-terminal domain-containing protein [Nitrososphaeraceae archaeon]MDW0332752.1 4-hydroxyphenylacetate 3-hydroxylase N-terminal domain-containing protein [Nitrososphaeraceae archaeon]